MIVFITITDHCFTPLGVIWPLKKQLFHNFKEYKIKYDNEEEQKEKGNRIVSDEFKIK